MLSVPAGGLANTAQDTETMSAAKNAVADVFLMDQSRGWATYDADKAAHLARTLDGGRTWTTIRPAPLPVSGMYSLTPKVGWAFHVKFKNSSQSASCEVSLYSAKNNGHSWARLGADGFAGKQPFVPIAVLFIDLSHGWIIGESRIGHSWIYQTADGGATFHKVRAVTRAEVIRGIASDRKKHIWIYGDDALFYSPDLGKSWIRQIGPDSPIEYRSLSFSKVRFSRHGGSWTKADTCREQRMAVTRGDLWIPRARSTVGNGWTAAQQARAAYELAHLIPG
ncbi:MAG TPA: hypothetical protein VN661_08660 [Candidatus Acidoferrales bacterium]|nr:hypothetical protein [Candidatus Acidoferrales bacterium]